MHFSFLYALIPGLPDVANRSLWNDITGMTLFSKIILVFLLFLSIVSWAIMFFKFFRTRKTHRETDRFLGDFRRQRNLDTFYDSAGRYSSTPFAGMLRSAYDEIRSFTGFGNPRTNSQVSINGHQLDLRGSY